VWPTLDDAAAWGRIAITPMIGRNDVESEYFTLADARALVAFARAQRLARLSFWSISRDRPCTPDNGGDEYCSRTAQSPWAFTRAFAGYDAP
jgi:hypothetical protein